MTCVVSFFIGVLFLNDRLLFSSNSQSNQSLRSPTGDTTFSYCLNATLLSKRDILGDFEAAKGAKYRKHDWMDPGDLGMLLIVRDPICDGQNIRKQCDCGCYRTAVYAALLCALERLVSPDRGLIRYCL